MMYQILQFIICAIGGAAIYAFAYHTGKRVQREQVDIDLAKARHDLDEIEAHEMNAKKAAKFRVLTAEADPSKRAVVKTARVRAFKSRAPGPKR